MMTPQSSGVSLSRPVFMGKHNLAGPPDGGEAIVIAQAGPNPVDVNPQYPVASIIKALDLHKAPSLDSDVTVTSANLDPAPLYRIKAITLEFAGDKYPAHVGEVQRTWLLLADPLTDNWLGWFCAAVRVRTADGSGDKGVEEAGYAIPVSGIDDPFVGKYAKFVTNLKEKTSAITKFVADNPPMANPLPDAVKPPQGGGKGPDGSGTPPLTPPAKTDKTDKTDKTKTSQVNGVLLIGGLAVVMYLLSQRKKAGAA